MLRVFVFCFFFTFLCYSAKELSSVSKRKKAVTCLMEKPSVSDKLRSGLSYGVIGRIPH